MEETTVTSGVEAISEPVAAEQEEPNVENETVTDETSEQTPTTGEEHAPAAGEENKLDERVEVAFAKRLNSERQKIAAEVAQAARDALIAELNMVWNGKPIKTEAEYREALREKEIMDSLSNQNLPPEVVEEIIEGRRFREQFQQMQRERSLQERIDNDLREFAEYYPDVKLEEIPEDVYQLCGQKGLSLLDAYNRLEAPRQIAKLKQAIEVKETNDKNANNSPGSVTGQGKMPSDFISQEIFEANKADRGWVIKNLSAITKSLPKW